MALRPERRRTNPERMTISIYIDRELVRSLDERVSDGEFANRSDAIEQACRGLVHIAEDLHSPEAVPA